MPHRAIDEGGDIELMRKQVSVGRKVGRKHDGGQGSRYRPIIPWFQAGWPRASTAARLHALDAPVDLS